MASVWRKYEHVLDKYPLPTTCATTGTLMAAGDGISQLLMEGNSLQHYDILRSARFFVLGLCVLGPMMRFWYLALDKMYSGTKFAALKMVVTDQTVWSPAALFFFISGMGVLKGETPDQIYGNLRRDYLTIIINNYKVWPLVQTINFFFMPPQHRILFINFVALGWNTFIAWITESKRVEEMQ